MALIMSIPIRSIASTQISAFADFTRSYEGNSYDFHVYGTQAQGLPQNYSFNSDVIDFVISKSGDAYNHTIYDSGIYFRDWVINNSAELGQSVLSLFANAYIAVNSAIQDYVYRDWVGVYLWEFEYTGSDDNYPGSADYGTAYGFTFHGLCGDKIDLVLDSSGDFYGQNRLGNWTFGVDTPEYIPHIIHQADPDNIYIPDFTNYDFNDLKPPYISGKSLHFFIYTGQSYVEAIVPNFVETLICFDTSTSAFALLQKIDYYDSNIGLYIDIFQNDNGNMYSGWVQNSVMGPENHYTCWGKVYFTDQWSGKSLNLPSYYGDVFSRFRNGYTVYSSFNNLGLLNGSSVSGSQILYLHARSYTPVTPSTDPLPVNVPIPVEQIPDDPEDPLPNNPSPDPVPGITYPVNPIPPIIRPVPSIVSGNDDLWPSVVELQNIEIDLSGYLSSLGDFEFPDLSTITESFASSIVWVSALMSTLFNGSDFSILFAVLSSFFIVAALLGLYKWWNHK